MEWCCFEKESLILSFGDFLIPRILLFKIMLTRSLARHRAAATTTATSTLRRLLHQKIYTASQLTSH